MTTNDVTIYVYCTLRHRSQNLTTNLHIASLQNKSKTMVKLWILNTPPPSLTTVKCLQQVPSTASPKMPSTKAPNRFHLNQCPQQMTAGGDSNRYPKDDQNRQVLQQVPQINVQMCAPDKCVPQEIDALKQVPSTRCPLNKYPPLDDTSSYRWIRQMLLQLRRKLCAHCITNRCTQLPNRCAK